MSAYLIICGALGFLALTLVWVAGKLNTAGQSRKEQLNRSWREADAAWARTLELEGTQRRITQRRHAVGRLRR